MARVREAVYLGIPGIPDQTTVLSVSGYDEVLHVEGETVQLGRTQVYCFYSKQMGFQ